MDKITKLSQAIRLGATFRKEYRSGFFSPTCGSCAIFAAAEALGFDPNTYNPGCPESIYGFLENRLPNILPVLRDVSYRHFIGKETREQIADWLESQGL